jgi:hypothetical protein
MFCVFLPNVPIIIFLVADVFAALRRCQSGQLDFEVPWLNLSFIIHHFLFFSFFYFIPFYIFFFFAFFLVLNRLADAFAPYKFLQSISGMSA